MSSFPCLVRFVSGSGQVRYRLGDRLVDRYLSSWRAGAGDVCGQPGKWGVRGGPHRQWAAGVVNRVLHPGGESGFYPPADVPVLWRRDDGYRPVPGIAGGE